MRTAWSYAWATLWMLRAIEASQVKAGQVQVDFENKVVKLYIAKSKTDQKGAGVWRTLGCCKQQCCTRERPLALAIKATNDLNNQGKGRPTSPDDEGNPVSKVHMVAAWAKHIDEKVTGHTARRSGATAYAKAGRSIHNIQLLGRWRSPAVFVNIEDTMAEVPMNTMRGKEASETNIPDEKHKKRDLKPKAKAQPKEAEGQPPKPEARPLAKDQEKERCTQSQCPGEPPWSIWWDRQHGECPVGQLYVDETVQERRSKLSSQRNRLLGQQDANSASRSNRCATESVEPESGRKKSGN